MLVKSATIHNRIVLWERDKAHPSGEITVKGDGVAVDVGLTSAVQAALVRGDLVDIEQPVAVSKEPIKADEAPKEEPPKPQKPRGRPRKFIGEVIEDD